MDVHRFLRCGHHSFCRLNVTAKPRTASQVFRAGIHSSMGGCITVISKAMSQLVEHRDHKLSEALFTD